MSSITTGTISLSTSNVRAVLDAAGRLDAVVPGEDQATEVLGAMRGLVPCDVVFWDRSNLGPRRLITIAGSPRLPDSGHFAYRDWVKHVHEHPIMSRVRAAVVALSDVSERRLWQHTWMYQEVLRGHVKHEIGVHLSAPPGQLSVVCLSRCDGSDFGQRDRVVLTLLRPHLDAAMRRLTTPAPRLTARETDVLRCVRDGCSNIQVARRLGITEGTVEKHLENIYARTGARSRVQALNLCATSLD